MSAIITKLFSFKYILLVLCRQRLGIFCHEMWKFSAEKPKSTVMYNNTAATLETDMDKKSLPGKWSASVYPFLNSRETELSLALH